MSHKQQVTLALVAVALVGFVVIIVVRLLVGSSTGAMIVDLVGIGLALAVGWRIIASRRAD
jgi:hypothetical protein